jgi:hypothetical protein
MPLPDGPFRPPPGPAARRIPLPDGPFRPLLPGPGHRMPLSDGPFRPPGSAWTPCHGAPPVLTARPLLPLPPVPTARGWGLQRPGFLPDSGHQPVPGLRPGSWPLTQFRPSRPPAFGFGPWSPGSALDPGLLPRFLLPASAPRPRMGLLDAWPLALGRSPDPSPMRSGSGPSFRTPGRCLDRSAASGLLAVAP